MSLASVASKGVHYLRFGLATLATFQFAIAAPFADAASKPQPHKSTPPATTTPIQHVIVIIGENRSFDHVFATYVPKSGQTINNLLSEGIISLDANKNAIPGPNFNQAQQLAATDTPTDSFLLDPPKQQFPSNVLPAPLVGGPTGLQGYFSGSNPCNTNPPIPALAVRSTFGNRVADSGGYFALISGGTGLPKYTPDTRINNVTSLPAGPFQITNGSSFIYNDYAQSPVHRFYQMWQQMNCNVAYATPNNPSGCTSNLFSWVETTVGAGTNGTRSRHSALPIMISFPASPPTICPTSPIAQTTGEGSTALAFYNVQQGDVPYFTSLANTYTLSDNFHQSVIGGTGA